MTQVRRSLAYTALDSYAAVVMQIISTAIIARILTPAQTGVFAVAAVFASLASNFRDFGVGEFLIQEKTLSNDTIRSALTVNIVVSWTMAALLAAISPIVATFYRDPGVGDVIRIQALSFLLIPFGAITMAWLRREMNFKPIFWIGLTANLSSFAVSVSLALAGYGYLSLAWGSLANVVVTVLASTLARPAGFPLLPGRRDIGRVVRFGKFASGIYLFGQLGKSAPELIVGRVHDMAAVGMFSRGGGFVEIFNRLVVRAVMPVCLPFFAKDVRETGTPRRGLLASIAYITGMGWPFLLCMAIAAYAAIRLMYGPQWMAAVPLAQVLCLVAAIELVYFASKEVLLSMGRASDGNYLQMSVQSMRVVSLLAAVPFGLQAACWGLVAAAAGGAVHSHYMLARHGMVSLRELAPVLMRSAKVTVITAAPLLLMVLNWPVGEGNYIAVALVGAAACLPCWLAALRWTDHPLWQEFANLASRLRQRKK